MLGYFELKQCIVGIVELFHSINKFAFIALSDLSIFSEHFRLFFYYIFFWIFLPLLFLFFLCHLHVHFSSQLFCIGGLHFCFLLFCHVGFQSFSLFLLLLLFSFFYLFEFYLHEEIFLQGGQILDSFNSLGWGNVFAIVNLKSGHVSYDKLFASLPIFARISCQIKLLEAGQLP